MHESYVSNSYVYTWILQKTINMSLIKSLHVERGTLFTHDHITDYSNFNFVIQLSPLSVS